jgi:hypothetical protein
MIIKSYNEAEKSDLVLFRAGGPGKAAVPREDRGVRAQPSGPVELRAVQTALRPGGAHAADPDPLRAHDLHLVPVKILPAGEGTLPDVPEADPEPGRG